MSKDWTGNKNSIYTTLGASNHTDKEREQNDYYATEPKALELLLPFEVFTPYVWECACGEGHLSEVLKAHGYKVKSSDIIDRGYPGTEVINFLKVKKEDVKYDYPRDIITNPPYKYAKEFVEKALEISMDGTKVAMFLKLTFLESKKEKKVVRQTPAQVHICFILTPSMCYERRFYYIQQGRRNCCSIRVVHMGKRLQG